MFGLWISERAPEAVIPSRLLMRRALGVVASGKLGARRHLQLRTPQCHSSGWRRELPEYIAAEPASHELEDFIVVFIDVAVGRGSRRSRVRPRAAGEASSSRVHELWLQPTHTAAGSQPAPRSSAHIPPQTTTTTPRPLPEPMASSTTYPSSRGTEPRSSLYPAELPISLSNPGRLVRIYAGKLFDPHALQLLPQRVVTVSEALGLVVDVRPYAEGEASAVDFARDETAIDLRDATVLPGFVDAHVHLFLHPYAETSWEDQLTKESLVERTVRATVHAKRTLMAGYTAVRDLGTEGAEDADIQLRKCLSGPNPLIPGPRYFCANRAIIASGSYGPKSLLRLHQDGIEGVTGAQFADGEVECVKAVRRQVGAGADWIKASLVYVYADYRVRTRMADVSTKLPDSAVQTFASSELRAMVSAARQLGVKVAAHAQTWRADLLPENGGVDTLEHGNDMPDDLVDSIVKSAVIWVPTLSVFYTQDQTKLPGGGWDSASRTFQKAIERGMTNVACGGDTGPFPHGDNALEMKLMVGLGADWRYVLRWATLGGWQCIRSVAWEGQQGAERLAIVGEMLDHAQEVGDNEVPFGVIRRGFAADIVATTGNLENEFENAVDKSSITFVMKGGKVFKRDGRELV
ncbi:hypothetical protein GSI_05991 [Ganoderma sinense ZZ0214-1]|uniref:Amidohydrolase-related domain-containing protein n=1 Tax=Ganoderma sinense ZZ0214-1 TaxID=1077348 RepID=A0A2G8SC24_9APHY|nr:hypothetical protein GSI_05991 [Ganoderma sinense ZZ0214-1]